MSDMFFEPVGFGEGGVRAQYLVPILNDDNTSIRNADRNCGLAFQPPEEVTTMRCGTSNASIAMIRAIWMTLNLKPWIVLTPEKQQPLEGW